MRSRVGPAWAASCTRSPRGRTTSRPGAAGVYLINADGQRPAARRGGCWQRELEPHGQRLLISGPGRDLSIGLPQGPPAVLDLRSRRRTSLADGEAAAWSPRGGQVAFIHHHLRGGDADASQLR